MSWVGVGIAGASLLMSYSAGESAKNSSDKEAQLQREAGIRRKAASDLEANALEVQASNSIASAQRDMIDIRRQTELVQSRALALSAASGGGASAPTVLNLVANMAKEGSYNAARALYAGEEKSRVLRLQAQQDRVSGEFAGIAGMAAAEVATGRGRAAQMSSYGSILSTGGSMYAKYGGRGPSSSSGGGDSTAGTSIDT